MRAVRVDQYGERHCWSCLSTNFERTRTVRLTVISVVGGRDSKKTLKCRVCGQYNDVRNAKKITIPRTTAPASLHPSSVAESFDRLRQRHEGAPVTIVDIEGTEDSPRSPTARS